jgi:hypothetical protein
VVLLGDTGRLVRVVCLATSGEDAYKSLSTLKVYVWHVLIHESVSHVVPLRQHTVLRAPQQYEPAAHQLTASWYSAWQHVALLGATDGWGYGYSQHWCVAGS